MAKVLVRRWPLLFTLALAIFITLPLVEPGFFASHDGPVHVTRQVVFHQALIEGQLPPRWGTPLLHGYGYPLFLFLYPLPLMLGELPLLLGMPAYSSIELLIGSVLIAGSLGMYFLGKRLFGNLGGLVAAVCYSLFPYRALEVYVRGSVGEIVALGVVPWLLGALHRLRENPSRPWWVTAVLLLSLLILSHNILAMVFVPIVGALCGVYWWQTRKVPLVWASIVPLSIGLTAWFWLPALWERKYTILQEALLAHFHYRDHFVTPRQLLLYSPWGYGGSKPGPIDGMSFLIPKEFLALFIVSVAMLLLRGNTYKENRLLLWFWVVVTVVAAGLTLTWSQPVWDLLPFMLFIQYPWRLLALVMVGLSIVAGAVVGGKTRAGVIIALSVTVLLFVRNSGYFRTGPESPVDGASITSAEHIARSTTTYADEHLPVWVREKPTRKPHAKMEIVSGSGVVVDINDRGIVTEGTVELQEPSTVRIHTFYYPGWQVWVDDRAAAIEPGIPFGTLDVAVPKGKYTVRAALGRTGDQLLGIAVSLGVALGVVYLWHKYSLLEKH